MAKISIHDTSCMRLTSNYFIKHTLEREQLPCGFLESYAWIFYKKVNKYRREVASGETKIYRRRTKTDRPPHP